MRSQQSGGFCPCRRSREGNRRGRRRLSSAGQRTCHRLRPCGHLAQGDSQGSNLLRGHLNRLLHAPAQLLAPAFLPKHHLGGTGYLLDKHERDPFRGNFSRQDGKQGFTGHGEQHPPSDIDTDSQFPLKSITFRLPRQPSVFRLPVRGKPHFRYLPPPFSQAPPLLGYRQKRQNLHLHGDNELFPGCYHQEYGGFRFRLCRAERCLRMQKVVWYRPFRSPGSSPVRAGRGCVRGTLATGRGNSPVDFRTSFGCRVDRRGMGVGLTGASV